jgi:hypothetical protein
MTARGVVLATCAALACSALAIVTTPGEVAAQLSLPTGHLKMKVVGPSTVDWTMSFPVPTTSFQIFFGHGVIEHGSGADWGNPIGWALSATFPHDSGSCLLGGGSPQTLDCTTVQRPPVTGSFVVVPKGVSFSGTLKFSSLSLPDSAYAYGYMGTGAVAQTLSVRFK